MTKRRGFLQPLLLALLSLPLQVAKAADTKNFWPMWAVTAPQSKAAIEHNGWQSFLDKHVITNEEGINLIDYPHIKKPDLTELKTYISCLSKININDYNRKEQLAYWINLYNALTVYTVASYYPISSIQDIKNSPGLFSVGPWGEKLITVNNTPLSLDDIQNRIIRPIWNDARTHYAINNASIGAANLSKTAYKGAILDEQLNQAAYEYINSLRGAQVIEGRLIVSKLYEWYKEDFGGLKQHVIYHIRQFAGDPLIHQLNHINTIDNYIYNWHLNSTFCSRKNIFKH